MDKLTPESWGEIESLFARAVDLPPAERLDFLNRECPDEAVRAEMISLLEHAPGDRLANAEAAIAAAAADMARDVDPDEQMIGARLGPYRLIAIAGHGGMGAVYRAARDDGEFHQQVAIKLVRAAAESPSSQQKFRQERQILARLSHPNIARLLDGGSTPEGVPYLVMEFIEGQPITAWCQSHSLSVEERLRIFLPVCDGVEAANREGVVHRDLKPANILVTGDGVPKLLDFGIAKLLSPSEGEITFTATRFRAMTPAYAAPEQVQGETVSAATDVYALGLVLYEVLTGDKAQQTDGLAPSEIEKVVCRTEPPRPAILKPQLAGDIDNIIRMAIRKEPERRYANASDLGEDIRRCLAGQPVAARPDTLTYRSVKFLRRNRVSFKAGVISAGCVVGAIVAAYWISRPPRPPRLLQVVQLTQAARINVSSRMVTDGSKLYFGEQSEGRDSLAEVPLDGGTTSPVPLPSSITSAAILDISPDRSNLLVASGPQTRAAQPVWVVATTGRSARQVPDVKARYAVWSRDGQHIFFVQGSAVIRVNLDGTDRKKLIDVPFGSYDLRAAPRPHPEALRISVFGSDMLSSAVWEFGPDGSGLHAVLPAQKSGTGWPDAMYSGDWVSPGNYYILRSRGNGISSFWAIRENRGILPPANAGQAKIYFTPMETRAFTSSLDGKRIFFAASQSRADLARYDAQRGQFLPFLRGVSAKYFDESRDGREVAYTATSQDTLWKAAPDGSQRKQLTFLDIRAFRPRWSPDGKFIAFTGTRIGEPSRAYVISSNGGNSEVLDAGRFEVAPSWSPDGTSLLVTRSIDSGGLEPGGIYTVDWKTRKQELLPGSEGYTLAEWSPDARFIAAVGKSSEVRLLDMKTRQWSFLAPGSGLSALCWSGDGKYLFFQDQAGIKGQPVFRARVSDRKVEQMMTSSQIPQSDVTGYGLLGLAPGDAPVVTVIRSNSDIYALDVDLP